MRIAVDLDRARPGDATVLSRMSRAWIEQGLPWRWRAERIAAFLSRDDTLGVVAYDLQERVGGFALAQYLGEHAHLVLLAVDPAWRRQGVGAQLVGWHEACALTAGLPTMSLEVRASSGGARAFYRRLGYRELETRPGYYHGREDAVRLARDLRVRS